MAAIGMRWTRTGLMGCSASAGAEAESTGEATGDTTVATTERDSPVGAFLHFPSWFFGEWG